jgi:prepilin-type N-terminal cleavage/methylation domain-containing protein
MAAQKPTAAFTIVELMVVVAVLGVLLAIAIPAYSGALERSSATACAKNRRLFDQAKQLWMVDQGKVYTDHVLFKDLLPEYVAEPPVCPAKGHYELNGLGAPTTCSVHRDN